MAGRVASHPAVEAAALAEAPAPIADATAATMPPPIKPKRTPSSLCCGSAPATSSPVALYRDFAPGGLRSRPGHLGVLIPECLEAGEEDRQQSSIQLVRHGIALEQLLERKPVAHDAD